MRALALCATVVVVAVAAPEPALAVSTCGGQKDSCKCGKNNPYPCCGNGSNCTWWSWHSACCHWKQGLPGWGNANTWAKYAAQNPNYKILGHPVVGSIATSTKGKYGHVAWVTGVGKGTVTVSEMNCCGTCHYGMRHKTHSTAYFNSGFVVPASYKPPPKCGNGKCESGETCAKCSKDCGSCCGNGKCDHGEKCATCAKDCACMPVGALERATCSVISGWARDDNKASAAVQVRVRVDGKEVAKLSAKDAHPKHGKHGFSYKPAGKHHDGVPHKVEAFAVDLQGKGQAKLGQRALLCENHSSHDGIWHTRREGYGGAKVVLGSAAPARLGVGHHRAKGTAWPTAGAMTTCTTPGSEPFEALRGGASWDLGGGEVRADLLIDGEPVAAWGKGKGSQELEPKGGGLRVCLRTKATKEAVIGAGRRVSLSGLELRRGGWWYSYAADTSGLLLGIEGRSELRVRARVLPGEAVVPGRGLVRAWRGLPARFDAVSVQAVSAGSGGGLGDDLAVEAVAAESGGEAAESTSIGSGAITPVSARATLAVQVRVRGDRMLDPGLDVRLRRLRVYRVNAAKDPPWRIENRAAWGLAAAVTAVEDKDADGRAVALHQVPMGWWATGALAAVLHPVEGAFERVSGRITLPARPTEATLGLGVDGEVIAPNAAAGWFELASPGSRFEAILTLGGELPTGTLGPATFDVADVGFLRAGWWTRHSPRATGLRTRQRHGDVRLETITASAPGAVSGRVTLQRRLTTPATGLRFTYEQALDPDRLQVHLLLDGAARRTLSSGPGVDTREVSLPDTTFESVAFALDTIGQGSTATDGFARASSIEVRDTSGVWWPIDDLAVPGPADNAKPSGTGASDAGCGAVGGGSAPEKAGLLWLLAVLLVGGLGRRHRIRLRDGA